MGFDVLSAAASGADGLQAMGEAQVSLLRKGLDSQQQQMASLLDALPTPPSLEPGKGARLDRYA
jgi:hypothetical protein